MTPKEHIDLCHKEYLYGLQDIESVYKQTTLVLGGQVLMGGALAALAQKTWLNALGLRFDVTVYYFCQLAAVLLLAAAFGFLISAARQRTYEVLAVSEIRRWECDYAKSLTEKGFGPSVTIEAVARELDVAYMQRICEAQSKNLRVQQDRKAMLNWAFKLTVSAVIPLSLIWILHCWLSIRG